MRFKVIKSHLDGISDSGNFDTIDDVCREVSYFRGWNSREELHASIRKWAERCRPGDVFCTQVTAIVAVAVSQLDRVEDECPHCLHKGLEYGDINAVEDGGLEQEVACPECGERWMDVFMLAEQHRLARNDNP